ncbi:unnamed protein product [Closterium sp. Yama58-4]|nr:unnamed protein product [Closterium sp. Yama58-4]
MGIRSSKQHPSPPSSIPKVFGDLTALVVEPLPAAPREGQSRNDEAGQTGLHPELLREMEALEASLQRHHITPQAAHIQGCRYLCTDPLMSSFSASPPCKVTTLAKVEGAADGADEEEQKAGVDGERKGLNAVEGREGGEGEGGVGEWEGAEERGGGDEVNNWLGEVTEEESEEESEEVASKVGRNAWVVERRCGGRQLVVAVERGCDSLLGAEELVDRLNAQHFGGVFPSH